MCLLYLDCYIPTRLVWLIHFEVKMTKYGRINIFRSKQTRNKNTADNFRCYSAYGKITIAFLDWVNKQARWSGCI